MTKRTVKLLEILEERAKEVTDGHYTIMRFTNNWRVCLGTPDSHEHIQLMPDADSLDEAILDCLLLGGDIYKIVEDANNGAGNN